MSRDEQETWDRRYSSGEYRPRTEPSAYLRARLAGVPRGRALDLGCGAGRNAMLLAEAGFEVDAIDVSAEAIAIARAESDRRGLRIGWRVADLDDIDLGTGYRLISMIRYMNRRLWPLLPAALDTSGRLVVEHHMISTDAAVSGPPGDGFRLRPQELLHAFGSLRILHYEELIIPTERGGSFALQQLTAHPAG